MIGIDLGTTNSLVACWSEDGSVLIPNSLGENLTPSVVGVDDNGNILVGKAAKERLISKPELTAAFFKRYMGTEKKTWLGDQVFRPEELSALVLRSLKEDAEKHLGEPVNEAVVSVPAYFGDAQRKATKLAGKLAGLTVRRLINEPTAAAIAYGLHQNKDFSKFLVLDLGGGTFDVSILEHFSGVMEVHATAGDTFLGGENFTDLLLTAFLAENEMEEALLSTNVKNSLRKLCEQCKHDLGSNDQAFVNTEVSGKPIRWKVTREKFETLAQTLLSRIRIPIERVIRDSSTKVSELDSIILVGGATRMSCIKHLVTRMFAKFPHINLNPDEIVGIGTGIQAGLKQRHKALKEVVLTDICPHSLGIEVTSHDENRGVISGNFLPIIERNTTVPVSKVKTVYTLYDDQESIAVKVYQGESRKTENNSLIGHMDIKIPPAPAGANEIEVRFTYDMNSILEIDVDVLNTQIKKNLTIEEQPGVLTSKEIEAIRNKLASLKIHPGDNMVNRTILARAERLYEENLGDQRAFLAKHINDFEYLLEKQDIKEIEKGRKVLNEILNQIEETGCIR